MVEKFSKFIGSKFYYIKSININKYNFVKLFNVKYFSYAGSIFKRLFDFYCKHSINLHSEYAKYYKKEFDSYNSFLYNKHNLIQKEIGIFKNKNSSYKDIDNTPESRYKYFIDNDIIEEKFYNFFGGHYED